MKMEGNMMKLQPTATWERITPFLAAEMLRRNTNNRTPRQKRVYGLADAMRRGAFKANGETIKFGRNNELIDGQHRLLAIVMSGVEQTILVVRDLERDEVFDTIDTGSARTGGDALKVQGEKHTNVMAAGLKTIVILEREGQPSFARVVAHDELRKKLEMYPNIRHWAGLQTQADTWRRMTLSGVCGVFAMFEGAGAEAKTLEDFINGVKSGAGLKEGDPRLVFRERMLSKKHGTRMETAMFYALFIKAVNAWVNDRNIGVLRWRVEEDFPKIGA